MTQNVSGWLPNLIGPVALADEGAAVTARPTINFTGAGVTATDNAAQNRIDIVIPGGGGAPSGSVNDVVGLDGTGGFKSLGPGAALPVGAVNGDVFYFDGTQLAKVAGPLTAGYVLTLVAGVPTWAASSGGGALNIDTLAFNLALRGAYTGLPWAGYATAGTSSTYSLTTDQCGTAPTVGATQNGIAAASFDGAVSGGGIISAGPVDIKWNAIASSTAYYGFAVIKVRSAPAAAAAIYDNPQIITDNGGNIGVAISSSGVAAYHFDSGFKSTGWKAVTLNAYQLVEWWYDGTNIHIAVNGVEGTPVAAAAATSLSAIKVRVGLNYSAAKFMDALLEEVRVAPTNLSSNSAAVKTYVNTRYGLAL